MEAAERAKTLVQIILRDISTVHAATINTEVSLTFDWLLGPSAVGFSPLSNHLLVFSSGVGAGKLRPHHKLADDGHVPGPPGRSGPQTAVRALHPGESSGSSPPTVVP